MRKLSIYFAAPLFNETERSFNGGVVERLEEFADVFLPQRDGSLLVDMVAAGLALAVAEARVYAQDCQAMRKADLLIAVLDGAHIDEGVAFELGYATALGRVCIGIQTDVRRALPTGNNPMIVRALVEIFDSIDAMVNWVERQALKLGEQLQAG